MHQPRPRPSTRRALPLAVLVVLALVGGSALAQDLQTRLDEKHGELGDAKAQKGVLTTEISKYTEQVNQLAGEVAVLRNREAIVLAELRRTQRQLDLEIAHLAELRERLGRSLNILSNRLVEIYKSDQPDALTVILEANGFDDLVSRYDYLTRIQDQDATIVHRVRDLRNESQATVIRIRAARDAIRAKKEELERTRVQLEAREAELAAVRDQKAAVLSGVEHQIDRLEGDIGDIEADIQSQLQDAGASTTTSDPLPAGPIQGGSSGFIWPVNGPVVSPFGWRWGRMHEGVDIAVPAGTPIRAAKAGTVVLAAYTGGYGNYTCVDHGGGLSTCYAHQSSYAITSGSVSQGDVLGYVGCTGHCYGDHLHFEVRINGAAVDPMGYL